MKTSIMTLLALSFCFQMFSSCQQVGFAEIESNQDGFEAPDLPPPDEETSCFNKDMESHINSKDEIAVSEAALIHLHLYSCDAMSLKEIQWLTPAGTLIKHTGDQQKIYISIDNIGEKNISAVIIYKDTVLDASGTYVEGRRPKIVSKKIMVVKKPVDDCANKDKDSHLFF